jgi:hypothetical protein
MTCWYTKNLGDAMLAGVELDTIEALARELALADAVFTRHEAEGRLHCELVVYFAPAAAQLAEAVAARPCRPPATAGLSVLGA